MQQKTRLVWGFPIPPEHESAVRDILESDDSPDASVFDTGEHRPYRVVVGNSPVVLAEGKYETIGMVRLSEIAPPAGPPESKRAAVAFTLAFLRPILRLADDVVPDWYVVGSYS